MIGIFQGVFKHFCWFFIGNGQLRRGINTRKKNQVKKFNGF